MAHGGTLTINPETGLPEAGFLDSILPTLLGGAATFFSGGTITPFMAALGVGGLTALTSKDLGKGLMAGLGAYGGSGIMQGLAGFGAADIGEKAIGAATADATAAGFVNGPIGLDPSGVERSGADAYAAAVQKGVADRMAGASYSDKLKAGALKAMSNPGDAFNAIGGGSMFKGAAMLGAPLLAAISTQDQTSVPTAEQIKFDPRYANINISRQQRPYQPDTGGSGERRYFGNTYVTQYADGGAVANDGIQHFAYGGGTIDPTYDYSGYGDRSKSSGMRPITYTEAPKPDFVGADGKTYRYDPVKKSWYVIKEAEAAKVNPGVETLMGDGSPAGGENPPNTTPNWGVAANIGKTLSDMGLNTIGGYVSQQAREGRTAQQGKATDIQDSSRDDTSGPMRGKSGDVDTDIGPAQAAPVDSVAFAAQAARDAATSASSPTATGGKANSPSEGLASLATALAAPTAPAAPAAPAAPEAETGFTSLAQGQLNRDATAAAKTATENSLIDAVQKEAADKAAAFSTALAAMQAQQAQNVADAANVGGTGNNAVGTGGGFSGGEGGGGSYGGGVGDCVDPSTLILLANGTQIPAGELKVGDFLHTLHEDTFVYGDFEVVCVKTVQQPKNIVTFTDGHSLTASDSHKFLMSNRTWKRVDALEAGDTIETAKGVNLNGFKTVAKIEAIGLGDVVKLTIDNAHTYISEGLVSHNKDMAYGGMVGRYAQGGLGSLGGYSDGGRLLRGPGDGVSDSIPATVGNRQPARLADGEFVVPARIVSELGNGSTEAGARALYKMMDRIQANRRKTTGKNRVAVNSKSHKYLPA